MRAATFCLVALLLVASAFASSEVLIHEDLTPRELGCDACVSFMNQAIGQLLNIIEQVGVLSSCAEGCSALPNQYLAIACDLLCEYEGVTHFQEIVQDIDPDPVWICMELDACPSTSDAAANVKSVAAVPKSGPVGTTFKISIDYEVTKATGMGDVALVIFPPKGEGFPIEGDFSQYMKAPGNYTQTVSWTAKPGQMDPLGPGNYELLAIVCEGPCSCTHKALCYQLAQGKGIVTLSQ
eukprot:TRINITY_DN12406_c0_g1_i1.p1 TRINITY_DN12406_c0_g1~~TRINITY_DN12406_c0_g1_i1.p1  ORF type:complete len:238 (-),score=69.02 TRINITY_DN12406_c0_g1_i1:225-938(-)